MSANAGPIALTATESDRSRLFGRSSRSAGLTAADFYSYNNPFAASYDGDVKRGPTAVSEHGLIFFAKASDGLALFVV